jgi:hypothetical protein
MERWRAGTDGWTYGFIDNITDILSEKKES